MPIWLTPSFENSLYAASISRKNIGVHVCPGGDVDSVHSADVPYEELLKQLFKLNAGYFQLQMASERDREAAYKLVGNCLREDANGIPQMAYIGCIVTQSPRPESAQEVCDQLVAAANYIGEERLGSTDDCGFSPFSIDQKPKRSMRRTPSCRGSSLTTTPALPSRRHATRTFIGWSIPNKISTGFYVGVSSGRSRTNW
jgi:methionine synthase II (cobalamin-independent)